MIFIDANIVIDYLKDKTATAMVYDLELMTLNRKDFQFLP